MTLYVLKEIIKIICIPCGLSFVQKRIDWRTKKQDNLSYIRFSTFRTSNTMKYGDHIDSSRDEIETLFNVFFISTESESLINVDEASRKIFKQFQLLNNKKLLNLNSVFSFKKSLN